MSNYFIILAAGESKRFNSSIPKAYTVYKGKPVVQHSIDKAKKDIPNRVSGLVVKHLID